MRPRRWAERARCWPSTRAKRRSALAKANAELNGASQISIFESATASKLLDALKAAGERFGAIVLDPPKFARSRAALDDALMAYHRLNRTAAELLEPGGILITCSCSGHVAREDFLHMISGVAQRSGAIFRCSSSAGPRRTIRSAQAALETEYLKCFICRVV